LAFKETLDLLKLGMIMTWWVESGDTQENFTAWTKFFSALEGLETIDHVDSRSFNLSAG
jgi:hypothetical protein